MQAVKKLKMKNSKALRAEAIEIVRQLGVLEMLKPFGEAQLVGSVPLDLVVKPDIDIHLLLDGKEVMEATKEITELLIVKKEIKEIRVSNYLESDSLKIGIDRFSGKSAEWSIDIWVTSDPSTTGFEITENLKKKLRPEHRAAILDIKRSCYEQGELRASLSLLIYQAVVENGVSGPDEFQAYLEQERGGA